MPSFNLPQFSDSSAPNSSPKRASASDTPLVPPRPVLSAIQPTNDRGSPSSSKPKPPLSPTTTPIEKAKPHMRALSSPPAYISFLPSSSSSSTPTNRLAVSDLVPVPRRKPLSKRYTRPASLSHMSNRSPLQTHSIPSFSWHHPSPAHAAHHQHNSTVTSTSTSAGRPGSSSSTTTLPYDVSNNDRNGTKDQVTLFEELLTRNLERKMRERVHASKRMTRNVISNGRPSPSGPGGGGGGAGRSGGQGSPAFTMNEGPGGLKPGRELLIWSAVNRCQIVREKNELKKKAGKTFEQSGLDTSIKTSSGRESRDEERLTRKHEPSKRFRTSNSDKSANGTFNGGNASKADDNDDVDDGDDDDDDEPLARKLQEAIEKREKQLIRLQAERAMKSSKQRIPPSDPSRKPNMQALPPSSVIDVQVKVRLPASPRPAFLKPVSSEESTPVPSLPSPPASFELDRARTCSPSMAPSPLLAHRTPDGNVKSSKRLRRNPTAPCPPSLTLPAATSLSNRSLSLPALPPRIATASTVKYTRPPTLAAMPRLGRSKSENTSLPPETYGTPRNAKMFASGMKRHRSDENGHSLVAY